jgi:hypothetical protein
MRLDARFNAALSRAEWAVAWRLLLLFCLCYIYELANFNLTIDDEVLAQASICHFADIGRWVHPLLRATLWPQVVVPSGPLLLFGSAFAASFIYIARLFGIARFGPFHYAAFAAYALFPTWFAQMEFSANLLPNALGLLATTYAALLTVDDPAAATHRRGWRLAGAVACCTLAMGAYQSLGLMYLALAAGAAFPAWACVDGARPAWPELVRTAARVLLVLVLGLAFSLLIGRLVMQACQVPPSEYGLGGLHFGEALHHPLRALELGLREVGRLYFGFWLPFGRQVGLTYSITVLLCCVALVGWAARGARWRMGGVLLVLLMIPTGLSVVGANGMAVRTFFAGAAVLLCLLLMAYRQCRNQTQRRMALALALLCAVQGLYVNSVQQARGWAVAQHDLSLAGAIGADIMRLPGVDDNRPIEVNFRGKREFHSKYPILETGTTGASFFEWDDGNVWRIVFYMNLLGYDRLRVYPEEPPGAFDQAYAQMPVWPAPGSIKRFGKGYLVKLSESPAAGK